MCFTYPFLTQLRDPNTFHDIVLADTHNIPNKSPFRTLSILRLNEILDLSKFTANSWPFIHANYTFHFTTLQTASIKKCETVICKKIVESYLGHLAATPWIFVADSTSCKSDDKASPHNRKRYGENGSPCLSPQEGVILPTTLLLTLIE